ncbi:MAG: L,D-transpeptidase family protein [Nitrospinae bacterium]|nr:L,D-transpeptidase family protein [Nitrospinota bacterium]
MLHDIKRFILLKLKTAEYRLWVYRQNIAINRAFRLEARHPYPLAVTSSFLIISLMVVSYIVVYNIKGNIIGYSRQGIPVVEANLAAPPALDIQRIPPPSVVKEFEKREGFTIAIDKVRKELFVLSRSGKDFRIVERFNVLLAKNGGDKEKSGDMKTPEGAYKIISVKGDDELLPMYGPMAFVLNYPNDMDKKQGKTGTGIWIHGIGDENREPVTKGCIALDNNRLLRLSSYIKIDTRVFIFPEGFMIPVNDESVTDILNESFIMELKNSMVASNQ